MRHLDGAMSEIQSRIDVLRPAAGDSIVLSVAGPLTADQREHICRACHASLPAGVKVLVLDSRISLMHIAAPVPEAAESPRAVAFDYDAWIRDRTERAHSEFMERTSKRLMCDVSPEEIERYIGGAMG